MTPPDGMATHTGDALPPGCSMPIVRGLLGPSGSASAAPMRVVIRAVVGLVLGCALLLFAPATSVLALTLTVTTTVEGADPTPGDGICASPAAGNLCTPRAAVQTANALGG